MAKVTDVVVDGVASLKLELNKEEIRFLCDLFNNIGGSHVDSRRRISADLREAMRAAGVDVEPKCPNDLRGNITFSDLPVKDKTAMKRRLRDLGYYGDSFPY